VRHRVYGRHLNRDKNERIALFRGLIRNLVLQESITTTEAKAKAIKGLVDKLITKSKQNSIASKNVVLSTVAQKEIAKKLIEEIGPRYKERQSGFTRTVRLGSRKGDGAMMVKISLTEEDKEKGKSKKEETTSVESELEVANQKQEKEVKETKKKETKK
jgi:large subunit ribosomal protein L17